MGHLICFTETNMKRSVAFVAVFALLVEVGAGQESGREDRLPPPPAGKAWTLVWHDEFDGSTLDETKWETPPDGPRRDAWWMQKAVSVDGKGHLVIRTFKDGDRYIDGCARTRGKYERAFGYYEARIQLQRLPGHWPAFWLYNMSEGKIGDQGRDGSEIDIMEKPWLDDRVNHAIQWDGYGKEHRSAGKVARAPGLMDGFHTYSLMWTPTEYVFYIDGKETWRTRAGGVCQVPLYIKLSDEVGDWAGDIKKVNLPDEFRVDYVRVYDLVDRR
jgi:beta-glucanase (GH16 family)